MRATVAIPLLLLFAVPARAAGPELLDLVPANAAVVLGLGSFKSFLGKLDKLITEVDPTQAGVGAIIDLTLVPQLGLPTALDRDASLALLMASPKEVLGKPLGMNSGPDEFSGLFVISLGYFDDTKLAADMMLDRQTLQPGKVFAWKNDNLPQPMKALIKDKRLYLGTNEKALLNVTTSKSLRTAITNEQAATLAKADAIILVGPSGWDDAWRAALKFTRTQIPKPDADKLTDDLLEVAAELRFLAVGVRLDGGVGVNALAVFPKQPAIADVLGRLARGSRSSVAGLPVPTGSMLFAQAAVGNGQETSGLLRLLTTEITGGVGLHSLFARADQPAVQAVLASFWKQLKGDRLAVYQPKNPRVGQLAALAILESDNPAAFVAEVRKVVRLGNPGELKFDPPAPGDDRPLVEKLIKDLGSDDFDTREKATTRLTLIGRPALPFLETAMKASDAEIARRARDLHDDISQGAAQKRTELLGGKLPYQVAPTLKYYADVEKRGGADVDVIRIQLDGKDETLAPKLRDLFGPDWDKIRLVRRDKQVLVLFGSDVQLLEEALTHLPRGDAALASWPTLKEFQARADADRKLEVHISLVRLLTLTDPAAEQRFKDADRAGVTSAAFGVTTDRMQLDVWLPASEIRGVVHHLTRDLRKAGQ